MISGIIKVEVSVALTKTLIIPDRSQKPNLIILLFYYTLFWRKYNLCIIAKNALLQRLQFILKHLKMYNWVINKFSPSYKTIKCRKVKCISKESIIEENCRRLNRWMFGLPEKRSHSYFAVREPWTWHWSWKSCIARATYRLFTNL